MKVTVVAGATTNATIDITNAKQDSVPIPMTGAAGTVALFLTGGAMIAGGLIAQRRAKAKSGMVA